MANQLSGRDSPLGPPTTDPLIASRTNQPQSTTFQSSQSGPLIQFQSSQSESRNIQTNQTASNSRSASLPSVSQSYSNQTGESTTLRGHLTGGPPSGIGLSEVRSFQWTPPTTGQYNSSNSTEGPSFTPVFNQHSSIFEREDGWDLVFVPSQTEKHGCPICLLVLREPVQTECGHRFCRGCILRWLSTYRESEARCPVDNQPLEERQLFPDNFAKREILALNVKCLNHEKGCDRIVVLKHLQSHLNECTYSIVQCPSGCGEVIVRGQLPEHVRNSCRKRRIKCSMCQEEIVADKQQEHVIDCPMSSMSCPNCEQSLQRNRLSTHIQTECQRTPVQCQYAMMGCSYEGERQTLTEHETTCLVQHMSLIKNSLMRLWAFLQQTPLGSQPRTPSSLNIPPIENPAVGSGAVSCNSYFRNPGSEGSSQDQAGVLKELVSNLNIAAEHIHSHMSMTPANSVVSYASAVPPLSNLLQGAPPLPHTSLGSSSPNLTMSSLSDNMAQPEPREPYEESEASGNRTRSNIASYTSKPSNRQDHEMPMVSMTDAQLFSIKSQNDIQDESLARHDSEITYLRHQYEIQEKVITDMKRKMKSFESTIQDFEGRNGNGVYVWKIKNYLKLRRDAEKGEATAIHSGPFYSSFHGYKLCIRVNLNGVDTAKGSHLSLFIHFMQGEFDDLLDWPFNGRIVLTIVDQNPICEMRKDISETLMSKPNLAAFQRPSSARNHKGFGYMEFLPLSVINGSTYIRNDTLIIKASIFSTSS